MHGFNQYPDVFRIDLGLDAVTEIEDVASSGTEIGERSGDLLTDAFGGGMEHDGIEIALERYARAHSPTGVV
jgi:hypothetical protein